MNGASVGHETPSEASKLVFGFSEKDRVVLLEVRDVVIEPGIAEVVRDDFDNNSLGLKVGTEVYALAEWEYLYFHAWVDGHEIEGGLPLADDTYFKFVQPPKVEHWLRIQLGDATKTKSWVKYSDAVKDQHAIQTCKNFQHH